MNKSKQTNKKKRKRTPMSRNAWNSEKSPASGDLNCQKGATLGFLKTCTEKDKQLQ